MIGDCMKNLIKAIRIASKMNQEQFAAELGTTVLSINRWENGKTIPNRMAQLQLYNFCKSHDIKIAELILDLKTYEAVGYPPVSHSETYRTAYHPAYRVVEMQKA